jgi:hypothetical protein
MRGGARLFPCSMWARLVPCPASLPPLPPYLPPARPPPLTLYVFMDGWMDGWREGGGEQGAYLAKAGEGIEELLVLIRGECGVSVNGKVTNIVKPGTPLFSLLLPLYVYIFVSRTHAPFDIDAFIDTCLSIINTCTNVLSLSFSLFLSLSLSLALSNSLSHTRRRVRGRARVSARPRSSPGSSLLYCSSLYISSLYSFGSLLNCFFRTHRGVGK